MKTQLETAMNHLINTEIWSANQYLALQIYFERQQMPVLSHWLWMQARNSIERISRMASLLYRLGKSTVIQQTSHTPCAWQTPVEALDRIISLERQMDRHISAAIRLAELEDTEACLALNRLYTRRFYVTHIFLEILHIFSGELRRRLPERFLQPK